MLSLALDYIHSAWAMALFFASPIYIGGAAAVALVCLLLRIFLGNIGGWLVRTLVYAGIYYAIVTNSDYRQLLATQTPPLDMSEGLVGAAKQVLANLRDGGYPVYVDAAITLVALWLPVTIVGGIVRRFRKSRVSGSYAAAQAARAPESAGAPKQPFDVQRRENEKKQTMVIMMTDIQGYSARMEKDEAATYALLKEHNTIMRRAITTHRGKEIKTIGDAFMVTFNHPIDALRCGMAMQKDLHAFNKPRPANDQLRVRIGIHQGEVIATAKDVFGEGVNIAARMESITEPGGISISEPIYEAIRGKVEAGFLNIGIPKMKNIANPPTCYRVHIAYG